VALEGHVYYVNSTTPVVGATVLAIEANISTTTDSNGYFSLTLPPGTYSLKITSPTTEDLVTDRVFPSDGRTNIYVKPKAGLPGQTGVYGYVFDTFTGAPIEGAEVSVSFLQKTTTDKNGFYTLNLLGGGTYTLTCKKSGYEDKSQTFTAYQGLMSRVDFWMIPKAGVTPTPTPTPPPAERTATISGFVYLDNNPVAGAEVRADVYAPGLISGYWITKTDSSGKYTLKVVCPDVNLLYVVTATYQTYSQKKNILLSPNAYQTLDFYLTSARTPTPTPAPTPTPEEKATIKGKVVDFYSNAPVVGAKVEAVEQVTLASYSTATQSDGTFSLGVKATQKTQYKITISKDGYNPITAWAVVSAGETKDIGTLQMVLSAPPYGQYAATVYGTVRYPNLSPAPNVKVTLTAYQVGPINSSTTTTDVNGKYTVNIGWSAGIAPTGFKITFEDPKYYYEESLSLSPGERKELNVILRPKEGISILKGIPWWVWVAAGGLAIGGILIIKAATAVKPGITVVMPGGRKE
jgi:hypothetical protein